MSGTRRMQQYNDSQYINLLDLIQHTERVTTKIYGITDKDEILKIIEYEFTRSKQYYMVVLLLTDDKSRLSIKTITVPPGMAKSAEKIMGFRIKDLEIDLKKTLILQRAIYQGETYSFPTIELIKEIFPWPVAHIIAKVTGYDTKNTIVSPLKIFGRIVGLVGIDTPELLDYFVLFVKNFAHHISTALELGEETARRKRTQEQLEQKNKEMLDFTNVITHDLKKPLTAIKTICSLVKSGAFGKLDGDGPEALETGREAIDYMQELLDDLLACAKLEAGTNTLDRQKVQCAPIVDQVLGRLKYQIKEKNVAVSTSGLDKELDADPKGLAKILMNLVGNAVNYIGPGPDRRICISAENRDGHVECTVKDNGLGIPEETQNVLFQKFKRGLNVRGIGGTGLGLSIVKGTVLAHGGKIWFESTEGRGTAFHFTLG
jgi:signal transduction histidine kinase